MRGRVKLVWVSGHVGIRGNEIADESARKGVERTLVVPKPIIGVIQHVEAWIKMNVFQEDSR